MSFDSSRTKCHRFSLEDIKDATENFDENYVVGHGGEAKVYRAHLMLDGKKTEVAMKQYLKPKADGFFYEIDLMPKIQHPNIVSLLGYCDESGENILIYEYMANGSLAEYVQKKRTSTWQQRLKISLGAALGLKRLHTRTREFPRGIIHCDIKPDNILLDADWVAKISDFGMAHAAKPDTTLTPVLQGTDGYFPPEFVKYFHVTDKTDVYAFGVVLFQVLCQKMPWDRGDESYYRREDEDLGQWALLNADSGIWVQRKDYREILGQVSDDCLGQVSDDCLKAFTEIIRKCLHLSPVRRPKMDQVVLGLQNVLRCQERDDQTKRLEAATGSRPKGSSEISQIWKKMTSKVEMYALEEVYKHNKKNDCWMIISGRVYDVTPLMDDHPGGGEVLLSATGTDATNDFEDIGHSPSAIDMLEVFYMGDIAKVYTFKEVCMHNKKEDCWVIVSGKVYDVTPFMDDHPGGDKVLLSVTGKDATNDFKDTGHSRTALKVMEEFYVGEVLSTSLPK